jgi:phosphate transport system permease protein
LARGEPMVWLTGGGLALSLLIIAGLLGLVLIQGFSTFWPRPLLLATLLDGTRVLGEATRNEGYRPGPKLLEGLPAEIRVRIEAEEGWTRRDLFRVGNYDMYGEDFRWISQAEVVDLQRPVDAWLLERLEWGVWIGWIDELRQDGRPAAKDTEIAAVLPRWLEAARERRDRIRRMEKDELGGVNREIEELRLELRRLDRQSSVEPERRLALEARRSVLDDEYSALQKRIKELRAEDARSTALLTEVGGRTKELRLSELVRAFQPNRMGPTAKLGVYLQRWREFLLEEPREANTEGGVMPAIFGTFMMTVIMSLAVAPFGIVTALYLREYARQGPLVSGVRIAVNNLAGVPSIVFGVFGLGFFCYTVGGTIDSVFFSERLPRPTFGTGGLLWASLTLALLTVPVVIVATEEALSAVPRSMREGSYACGASRWQTIRRIVLPRAAGGIMTGLILAMARGAGEVAPLMLTGVVKLAPELPLDGHFPYLHLERSFMHLGFHIYDVGFQSRNAEAAKPMVFTTTLLLIVLILTLNLTAIQLRKRLRSRFATAKF